MIKLLSRINDLKSQLDELSPMSEVDMKRLWEKFRLLWNYNSNHIEGNTMTYGQTILLLKLGSEFRAENSPLKDVLEMKAHDLAVHLIQSCADDDNFELSEKFIKELNETILVEEYVKDAITSQGLPTTKTIIPGKYKKLPNHVLLPSGEVFNYAEPGDVIAEMDSLINWYRKENNYPVVVAAALHYKFICIHPFDDGNGRTARLIMNYHLMKNGFPPVIINSADKSNYFYALRQADNGNLNAFVEYIAKQLEYSLELALKAAKGEEIDEPGDIDKKLSIIKKRIDSISKNAPLRDPVRVKQLLVNDIFPAFVKYTESLKRFENIFKHYKAYLSSDISIDGKLNLLQRQELFVKTLGTINPISRVIQGFKYNGIKDTAISLGIDFVIHILFNEDHYYFENTLTKKIIRNNYNIDISSEMIDADISATEKIIIQRIEEAIKQT